ncbi:MAG: hypothetical protein WAT71_08860 [Ignavibacteria bacterium]
MISELPVYVSFIFNVAVILTAVFFYFATRSKPILHSDDGIDQDININIETDPDANTDYSKRTIIVMLLFLLIQGVLGMTGFFTDTKAIPPRMIFLAPPALLFLLAIFFLNSGKKFTDTLDPKILTYLHSVRIPVEIVLYLLFVNKLVPEVMTFEGNNFDILAGISAPFAAYFGYRKNPESKIARISLLIWNFICLGLLFNIVLTAVFSVPSPFQLLAIKQPNIGILYFPFMWLPGFIVPLVLFSHLVCIRKLL